jgi:hypothetical protein
MATTRRRIKRIHYRDQGNTSQAAHQAHWRGFEWEAGDWVVSYVGPWGEVQVWAATEAEGRRVIAHACAIASIPLTGAGAGEWLASRAKNGRNGKTGRFCVPESEGVTFVSKRDGPSGPAYL